MRKIKLFLDLDGVLADMPKRFHEISGLHHDDYSMPPAIFWGFIENDPGFFEKLEPMPDAFELWKGTKEWDPVILTGLPKRSHTQDYAAQKRNWVARTFGSHVKVIVCPSEHKIHHAQEITQPGHTPVLIDDWVKYKSVWEMGDGHFILHTSAKQSLGDLHKFIHSKELE